ncbi:MAG: hypothetical protein SVV03_02600 [Candidatus Nanohaloarchaea archaeon]|nr:hypothetical protein [Candidatus Nanohaloarchaea archaeon]
MNLWAEALRRIKENGQAEISKQVLRSRGVSEELARDIRITELPEEEKPLEEGEDVEEKPETGEDDVEWIE